MNDQSTTDKRTWQCAVNEVEALLETSASRGLTDTDAAERLVRFGPNQLREKKGRSPLGQFLDQFKDFIIWVLIGAAVVSGFLGEWVDALAIIAIVILNAIMGFVQEYRAEKSLAALKKLSSPSSKVIRDGDYRVVPSERHRPRRPRRARGGRQCSCRRPRRLAHLEFRGSGSQPDGGIDAGPQDRRRSRRAGRPPGRQGQHGLYGDVRRLGQGPGPRDRNGHVHRARQDRRDDPGHRPRDDAAPEEARTVRQVDRLPLLHPRRPRLPPGMAPRREDHRRLPDGREPRRGRHPRGPAGRRHHRPGPWGPADGPAPRPDPEAPVGRDARLRHRHLFG